jgi:hypothetical protein
LKEFFFINSFGGSALKKPLLMVSSSENWKFEKGKKNQGIFDILEFYTFKETINNSDLVSLFADSSLLVFSEIEYVMISIDVFPINLNEWVNIVVFESKKK